ncbi:MAG TPA: hypothetical protein VFW50_40750 [Streptosporangiaceae bacterium]|nr:hypothetical protein [Streptosporangiaceae bacterium]
MDTSRQKLALAGGAVLAVTCLAACGSIASQGAGSAAAPAATPRQVTPKNGGGSPGQGPLVVSGPDSLPGGGHPIVLRDRILIITSAARHPGPAHGSVLIDLSLVLHNTSGQRITNMPAFFQLIGPEGDSFSDQYHSSRSFYLPIGARTSRAGTAEFEIPAAAASSLSLLYRPGAPGDTALIQLTVH